MLYRDEKMQHGLWGEKMKSKSVMVIGGGVAGLSAANCLGRMGLDVCIVEKAPFAGGHAVGFTCKATDECVRCGACVVEDKLYDATEHPGIELLTGSQVKRVNRNGKMTVAVEQQPVCIDPQRCTSCGGCYDACPQPGAIIKGSSAHHSPFYAIDPHQCVHFKGDDCSLCQNACPEGAIDLAAKPVSIDKASDAVILATGFQAFRPVSDPYGYEVFPDVITTLELENMLRENGALKRPSNGAIPPRIAFIHCVGSRDAKLGHLWCSKVCCASALRMARLVKFRHPEVTVTSFYIDIQTFGKNFDRFYKQAQAEIELIRAIPGDIYGEPDGSLKMVYLDPVSHETVEKRADLVVLAVGITPSAEAGAVMDSLGILIEDSGFAQEIPDQVNNHGACGVFCAGAASGPMSIADSVASGEQAAWKAVQYLRLSE